MGPRVSDAGLWTEAAGRQEWTPEALLRRITLPVAGSGVLASACLLLSRGLLCAHAILGLSSSLKEPSGVQEKTRSQGQETRALFSLQNLVA